MNEQTPYLIVGLGNPGSKYEQNRHNVGFMVVDALAALTQIPIRRMSFRALMGKGTLVGEPVILAKPLTYMNNSGRAVASLMRFYKIPPEQLLVAHDDLDLPFGTLRLRPQGSAGGQRGMASIIQQLNTQEFATGQCRRAARDGFDHSTTQYPGICPSEGGDWSATRSDGPQ